MFSEKIKSILPKFLSLVVVVLLFLFGLTILSETLKGFGTFFVQDFLSQVDSPLLGLFIGMLVTAVVQSSSLTTTTVVAMVCAGMSLESAVPMIIGANIGTTITSTLVAFGHISDKKEYRRAVATATVHDFFNILCALILFPLELMFGVLSKSSEFIANLIPMGKLTGKYGLMDYTFKPLTLNLIELTNSNYFICLIVSLVLLFTSIKALSWIFKGKISNEVKSKSKDKLLDNHLQSFSTGLGFTVLVQSSSITTSLIVPFVANKRVKLDKAFSFIMGANIGTTTTAIIAAFSSNLSAALIIALVHLLFNLFGVLIFFPFTKLRSIPLWMAKKIGELSYKNRLVGIVYVGLLYFIIPLLLFTIFK